VIKCDTDSLEIGLIASFFLPVRSSEPESELKGKHLKQQGLRVIMRCCTVNVFMPVFGIRSSVLKHQEDRDSIFWALAYNKKPLLYLERAR
jgi:hypothetical protein